MIGFRVDNVLAPQCAAGTFDLILCRNVLLYFADAQRQQACAQIVRRARPGTFLVIGAGEMLPASSGFSACREMHCIYEARATSAPGTPLKSAPAQLPLPPRAALG